MLTGRCFQVLYCADDIKAAEAADRKDEKFVRPRPGWCICRAAFPTASTLKPLRPGFAQMVGHANLLGTGLGGAVSVGPTPGTPTAATATACTIGSSRVAPWASCLHSQLAASCKFRLAKQAAAQIAIVAAAVQALDSSLSKNDITELKAYNRPPAGVSIVADVITMLIDQLITKPDWKIAKKMMGGSKFLSQLCQFDLDGVKWSTVAVSIMVKCIPHPPL